MFKRVSLFLLVNFLVIISVSVITNFFGLNRYLTANGLNYEMLAGFCLVWGMTGAFISLAISRWTAKRLYGIVPLNPNTTNPTERDILSMVYAASTRAGISVRPEVGIYDSNEVNAFATGPTKNKALVALSTGLIDRMDRDQIEGVIGHEVAHIANGDMVTMTLLQGVVNAFVMFLSRAIAYAIMNSGRNSNERGGNVFMFYAVQIVLEIFLMILGSAVIAYYSRRREFAADAGSAKLVGREKMIRALQGLKGNIALKDVSNTTQAESFKVMQISNPTKWALMFSTHPSLDKRIDRLTKMRI